MPPKTKNQHSWERTGFDPTTNQPNVYTCRRCGMVKATKDVTTPYGHPGFTLEFSEPDGTLIGVDLKPVPACGGAR